MARKLLERLLIGCSVRWLSRLSGQFLVVLTILTAVVGNTAMASDYPEEHMFYRDEAGNIQHLIWARGEFSNPDQWNVAAGTPKAAGDPAVMTV